MTLMTVTSSIASRMHSRVWRQDLRRGEWRCRYSEATGSWCSTTAGVALEVLMLKLLCMFHYATFLNLHSSSTISITMAVPTTLLLLIPSLLMSSIYILALTQQRLLVRVAALRCSNLIAKPSQSKQSKFLIGHIQQQQQPGLA